MSLSPTCTAPDATSVRPFFEPPAETSTLAPLCCASYFSFAAFTSGWSALDPLTRTVVFVAVVFAVAADAPDDGDVCSPDGGCDLSQARMPTARAASVNFHVDLVISRISQ